MNTSYGLFIEFSLKKKKNTHKKPSTSLDLDWAYISNFLIFNLSKGIIVYEITLNSLFHCHEYRPKKANAKNVCMSYNENKYVIGNKVT